MTVAFLITIYKNDNLEYFKKSIESIIEQDIGFNNINIYLGIDGELPENAVSYINSQKGIFYKIIKNTVNNGLAFTLNKLIEILEEEKYIFRMDADDICLNDRVSKQVNFMEKNKNIQISGGSIEEIDSQNKTIMIRTYPKSTKEAKKFIIKASIFAHPAVCFRKTFFKKGLRYNEKYRHNEDIALWFDVLSHNIEVGNINDIVLKYRVSDDFYQRRSREKAFQEFIIYRDQIIKLYGISWKLVYPITRLIVRLMPIGLIKIFYSRKFRKLLNI